MSTEKNKTVEERFLEDAIENAKLESRKRVKAEEQERLQRTIEAEKEFKRRDDFMNSIIQDVIKSATFHKERRVENNKKEDNKITVDDIVTSLWELFGNVMFKTAKETGIKESDILAKLLKTWLPAHDIESLFIRQVPIEVARETLKFMENRESEKKAEKDKKEAEKNPKAKIVLSKTNGKTWVSGATQNKKVVPNSFIDPVKKVDSEITFSLPLTEGRMYCITENDERSFKKVENGQLVEF